MMLSRCVLMALVLALPRPADAQTSRDRPRFELSASVGAHGSMGLGERSAELHANTSEADGFALFATETRLSAAALGDVRVGVRVSSRLSLEGRLGYSRPRMETSVSADAEGAASITVAERIDQYMIDAGVVFGFNEMRFGRLTPYMAGGAGYLRQLHEGLTTIEHGHVYYLGGGLERALFARSRHVIKGAGLRADARLSLLSGGISVSAQRLTQASTTAGLFLRF